MALKNSCLRSTSRLIRLITGSLAEAIIVVEAVAVLALVVEVAAADSSVVSHNKVLVLGKYGLGEVLHC